MIELSQSAIAELAPAPSKPAAAAAAPPAQEKWKRENHPKFRAQAQTTASSGAAEAGADTEEKDKPLASFKVNDTVLAKWHSGDKGFYPARITSITGSSVDPVFIVKFRTYDTVETLRGRDIKAVSSGSAAAAAGKRKADGPAVAGGAAASGPAAGGGVISAEADIDREAQLRREREASKVGDGPARPERAPKKIKANKELERGKMKWQDFAAKGMGGKKGASGGAKKESMFRTPEGVHGRGMCGFFSFSCFFLGGGRRREREERG